MLEKQFFKLIIVIDKVKGLLLLVRQIMRQIKLKEAAYVEN